MPRASRTARTEDRLPELRAVVADDLGARAAESVGGLCTLGELRLAMLQAPVVTAPGLAQGEGTPGGTLRFGFGITTITLSHVAFNISFVAIVVRARLAGLEHELDSLKRRQSDLEDQVLELMERREAPEAELDPTSLDRAARDGDRVVPLFVLDDRYVRDPNVGIIRAVVSLAVTFPFPRTHVAPVVAPFSTLDEQELIANVVTQRFTHEIVLSQRFRTETRARPFDIYRALRVVNPSPFMFFLRAGEVNRVAREELSRLLGVTGSPVVTPRRR